MCVCSEWSLSAFRYISIYVRGENEEMCAQRVVSMFRRGRSDQVVSDSRNRSPFLYRSYLTKFFGGKFFLESLSLEREPFFIFF